MRAFISSRLKGMAQSEIRAMTRECERVGGINLGQGLGELPTPPLAAAGAKRAIDERRASYSFPEGIIELRRAIADKLARDAGMRVDPARQVSVSVGSSGAFTGAVMGLLNPGDGLLLLEPYYGYHLNAATLAGLEPQFLTLTPPDFTLREDALRAAVRPNTRAVVVCTPSNPSGKMFSLAELEALERVAVERDLLVITDEVYEYIVFDGRRHIPPASVGRLADRTVTISGFSKTFSITGWRIGYAAGPEPLIQPITMVTDLLMVCAPTPLQHAVAEGLRAGPEFFQALAAEYQKKRDMLCAALQRAGINPIVPQGAYYVLADVSGLGFPSAKAAAMALLEQTGVASVPGTAFYRGPTGEGLLRFCFAKEDAVLAEACRRIERFRPPRSPRPVPAAAHTA